MRPTLPPLYMGAPSSLLTDVRERSAPSPLPFAFPGGPIMELKVQIVVLDRVVWSSACGPEQMAMMRGT